MNFEVDRYSSAWAHIALCADLTWASDQPDGFIVANQRLWTQHCRVNQVLQDTLDSQCGSNNRKKISDQRLVGSNSKENGTCNKRSVKDVIPESRLAQFYGTFYYDDVRENCYTCTNERNSSHYSSNSCENTDPTECWMLPEVEYWFRKLIDNSDRNLVPRRRRQYKMLVDDDFERWGPTETSEEAVLKAKIQGVRSLWNNSSHGRPRVPSPLPVSRKIRARRRQSRKFGATSPNCILDNAQLHNDSNKKFDTSRPPQLSNYQRAIGRLSSSVQAFMRANTSKYLPYKGTFVNRYTPTGPRPTRYVEKRLVWWPGKNVSPRIDKLNNTLHKVTISKNINNQESLPTEIQSQNRTLIDVTETKEQKPTTKSGTETISKTKKIVEDSQVPTTSNKAKEDIRKKLLYSTVLSMSAPPIITTIVRTPPKIKPGLIKLNPKISAKLRPSIDKFEELEKEALEQYKDSDESIDTKFRELEKQAVEQYSNSNTSCSSDNSGEKKSSDDKEKDTDLEENFHKKKSVDSVVIYSQNFPDLNAKQTNSIHLKNFHSPPRGEKKELRPSKNLRNKKIKPKRPASDTDYESKPIKETKDTKENHQTLRWTLPKKRHMTLCMSDFSSDDDFEAISIKNNTLIKNHLPGKVKISTYGGGDLHPILRKT